MEKKFFCPVDLTKKQGPLVRKKNRGADPDGVEPDPDTTLQKKPRIYIQPYFDLIKFNHSFFFLYIITYNQTIIGIYQ